MSYTSAVSNEYIEPPESGEHKTCDACPHALQCLAGNYQYGFVVARTRKEHLEGVTVPCVDKGLVRLVVLTNEHPSIAQAKATQELRDLLSNVVGRNPCGEIPLHETKPGNKRMYHIRPDTGTRISEFKLGSALTNTFYKKDL